MVSGAGGCATEREQARASERACVVASAGKGHPLSALLTRYTMRSFSRKDAKSGGARRPLAPSMGMTATTPQPPERREGRTVAADGERCAGGGAH